VPGLAEWLDNAAAGGPAAALPVLCDFAGTESPLWAAQELSIPYLHLGSSDCAAGPQKYILRNFAPMAFWPNVLTRDISTLKRLGIGSLPLPGQALCV
jgi:hypothetical protein